MNSNCVDLIYLDPPFNSNRDYQAPIGVQFKDTWTLKDIDHEEHGELAETHPAAYQVISAARLAHGKSMMSYLIFMAVRLIEMQRILKLGGSIYLHCDDHAGHYLKMLLDALFGNKNFRRTIIWDTKTASGYKSQVNGYVRGHDFILYYVNSDTFTFNKHFSPHKPEYIARFKKIDNDGRKYRDDRPGGRKQYLENTKGVMLTSVWSDIMSFQQQSTAKELEKYPTQKPLALLDRIIEASSNKNDMVLDPFCGCATSLVAADRLSRQWAGIDLSPLAVKLVNKRIQEDRKKAGTIDSENQQGLFPGSHARIDPPKRTDGVPPMKYDAVKRLLFGEQEGVCPGCGMSGFDFKFFEVDHIIPKGPKYGGSDDISNKQLLCVPCNREKGQRTMTEWMAAKKKEDARI